MRDKVELLAPAGCEENFYGAVNHGANAVYLGLPSFSARKNASNFTFEKLQFIVAYAHIFGVKVFVAVNTVIKNQLHPICQASVRSLPANGVQFRISCYGKDSITFPRYFQRSECFLSVWHSVLPPSPPWAVRRKELSP